MSKIVSFGENVEGFKIPVLNEREIRAAAGILFVMMFISVMLALLKADFLLLKYSITFFFTDIAIRVFVNPKFAPSLILGRLIIRKQKPEYVGARQKKFAWIVGIILSACAFTLIVIMNTYSPVSGIICLVCLIFLFFESAFGICLGCSFYNIIYREKAQYCPGEVCETSSGSEIQRVSLIQYLIILSFIALIIFVAAVFNESFKMNPHYLFN